ncbi:DUF167 domain-containing protein [Haloechinothrix sp. YIM 98757]|uniref:UPF0235 protein H0B56_05295 n=1 Tax=Haloechinothrix aidingensis TaxID=2752311 RepID=A0A838A1D8_9PSEU|nr:DUF167 domain-containing protein [Haloechinothrix aidingensis]MBA0124953.1 DUF167 domain-containing protein [Haloechinothrix aidingensis]
MRFAVRVRPGAKRDLVDGSRESALGTALVVSVSAPANDGKANDAVRRTLARALGVRARELMIVRGPNSRDKLIELSASAADAADAAERLRALY